MTMKKIVLAMVALFTFGTAAMAQDAFEANAEVQDLNMVKAQQLLNSLSKSDVEALQQIGDVDFATVKDVSFATESGAVSTVDLKAGGNRIVASILAIFLGDFGIHHFYTGDTKHGLWHLVFFWTGVPGLIGLVEGIIWLVDEGSYPQALFGGII